MLIGGAIGLMLISFFLFTAGEPNPEWHKLWRIRPLILVTLAGATGGAINYLLMEHLQFNGWKKFLAGVLSVIVFIIGLWMGTVLGLDGTYWD